MSLLALESFGNIAASSDAPEMRSINFGLGNAIITTPARYAGFAKALKLGASAAGLQIELGACTFPIYFGYGLYIDKAAYGGGGIFGPIGIGAVGAMSIIGSSMFGGQESLSAWFTPLGYVAVSERTAINTVTPVALSTERVETTGHWHYVECCIDVGTLTNDPSTITVKIDGVQYVTHTGLSYVPAGDASTNSTPRGALYLGGVMYSGTGVTTCIGQAITDLYVCDSAGSAPFNTWLGEIDIQSRVPTGDSATWKEWARSTGSNNYALVDEVGPNDDTDYVSAAAAAKDGYTFPNLTLASGNVRGVKMRSVGRLLDPAFDYGQDGIVRRAGVDGLVTAHSRKANRFTPYTTLGSEILLETDPTDASAWTIAKVNAAEFGPRRP